MGGPSTSGPVSIAPVTVHPLPPVTPLLSCDLDFKLLLWPVDPVSLLGFGDSFDGPLPVLLSHSDCAPVLGSHWSDPRTSLRDLSLPEGVVLGSHHYSRVTTSTSFVIMRR